MPLVLDDDELFTAGVALFCFLESFGGPEDDEDVQKSQALYEKVKAIVPEVP